MLIPRDPDELDDETPSAAAEYAYVGPNDEGWKPPGAMGDVYGSTRAWGDDASS